MNVYEKIGLKRVINASGRMTALGVSTLSDEVGAAAVEGGQSYVIIDDLLTQAGIIISQYTNGEKSCVTSSASAAIAMSVAGIITQGRSNLIRQMPHSEGLVNEVLLAKGHSVSFGAPISTMISIGGGHVKEVGLANSSTVEDFDLAITDKTAAIMYVKSHHTVQKGMVDLQDLIDLAKSRSIPLIVDAAAEEDLKLYIDMGADLVIYSGAKAIEATTSGFVSGRGDLIDNIQKQYTGIGRPMKIGKEGIMGLLKALKLYVNRDIPASIAHNRAQVAELMEGLNQIEGLVCTEIQDEAGREIYRVQVQVLDHSKELNAIAIDKLLKSGNPSIHGRSHRLNEGYISLDTRPLVKGDIELIIKRFKEIMEGQ